MSEGEVPRTVAATEALQSCQRRRRRPRALAAAQLWVRATQIWRKSTEVVWVRPPEPMAESANVQCGTLPADYAHGSWDAQSTPEMRFSAAASCRENEQSTTKLLYIMQS
eukprot:522791-Pleurochrysis_carterae.AAC.1